jgi:transcriptional regulator with XRE-family HTH domain
MKGTRNSSVLQRNLKYLRELRKYSIQSMADALGGIHRGTYYSWERGDAQPNIEMLLKLAHEFDISVDELLNRELKNQSGKKLPDNTTGIYEVELVPYKAVAGYSASYADPEWRDKTCEKSVFLSNRLWGKCGPFR